MLLTWILLFSILGSVLSLSGAALVLVLPGDVRKKLISYLISYATGTLLGAAFLGMIPRAIQLSTSHTVLPAVLAGIILFFLLEKIVLWRHCHEEDCEAHSSAGPLILIGDAFHNFVDGVVIAAAFLTSVPLGIATALAVIAHEVPQEVGDFAVLLESGYSKKKAYWYNFLSSLSTLPGAILTYGSLKTTQTAVPYILALSAASFIYIATADLIPTLHRKLSLRSSLAQVGLLLAGVGTILFFRLHP